GMATGAFGSHGLRNRAGVTPDSIRAWETASHYTIYNGLGLLLISLHPRFAAHRFAGPAITAGGVVFSGSIFALALAREKFKWLGPITPLGGSLMMLGCVQIVSLIIQVIDEAFLLSVDTSRLHFKEPPM
ncbi:hypothetical protein BDY19DRAFT_879430, partial [Irpex rosettiformis]